MFDNFPLWPASASNHALPVDLLYIFLVALSAVMTLAIFAVIAAFGIKYRRRPGVEAHPIHGSLLLEIAWSVLPLGLFILIFGWSAVIFFHARTPPKDASEIYVVGKQWMWKIQHPEGPREINELHVPIGKDIKLIMTSQDVIHSFYIPEFRVKQDVLPGRYTTLWFRATEIGTFHLFCAQYCGTEHSGMIGQVVVMSPSDYQAWVSGGPAMGSLAQNGEVLFQNLGCVTCHRTDVQGRGPNLKGVFGKPVLLEDGRAVMVDDNYVRESILVPAAKVVSGFKPVMPSFQGQVTDEQLNSLVAYVKSLSQAPAGAAGAAAGNSGTAATQP